MPRRRQDPYNNLPKPPPLRGERATEVLPALRDADITLTAVQPFPGLRDALRPAPGRIPASAMELPLWRPGVYNPVTVPSQPPTAVEQTAIEKVLEQVAGHAHTKAFRDLLTEVRDAFRQEARDTADVYLEEQREAHAILRDLDSWAMDNGFQTAAARHIGRRLAMKDVTPEDALAELEALG